MKQKIRAFKPYGLRAHFALSLGFFLLLCGALFLVLYSAADQFLTNYFAQSAFMETHIQKQGDSLQEYIDEHEISSQELQQLKSWEYKQPLILLEVYADDVCLYSSFYDVPENGHQNAAELADEAHTVSVQLTDRKATAIIYSDFTYQYYVMGTAVAAVVALAVFFLLFLRSNRKLIHYICRLNEEVQILESGNLEYQVSVEGNDEITDLAKSMNNMRLSFQQQMETEQALHQANKRLITEMSHDLRTPLTGIMLYLEILRTHRYTSEEERQAYLEKIAAKALHMKQLSDRLFEYALTETSEQKSRPQTMQATFGKVVQHVQEDLRAQGFSVVTEIDWPACLVSTNEASVQRIFENLASNIVKYAEPAAAVTICTLENDRYCGFSVMNTCAAHPLQPESTGIGLQSIRTMMQQMNGLCTIEQTETAFEVTLFFPKQLVQNDPQLLS